jgi:hypothetical protein
MDLKGDPLTILSTSVASLAENISSDVREVSQQFTGQTNGQSQVILTAIITKQKNGSNLHITVNFACEVLTVGHWVEFSIEIDDFPVTTTPFSIANRGAVATQNINHSFHYVDDVQTSGSVQVNIRATARNGGSGTVDYNIGDSLGLCTSCLWVKEFYAVNTDLDETLAVPSLQEVYDASGPDPTISTGTGGLTIVTHPDTGLWTLLHNGTDNIITVDPTLGNAILNIQACLHPADHQLQDLGTSEIEWQNVYAQNVLCSGTATIATLNPTVLDVSGCTITGEAGIDSTWPAAKRLKTATGAVSIEGAAEPSVGQVLTASSSSAATWQAAPGANIHSSTGLISGGLLSVGAGADEFSVTAGEGVIVTHGSPSTAAVFSFGAATNVAVTAIASQNITFITVTSSGTIKQYASRPSASLVRDEVYLGVVVHVDRVNVDAVNQEQATVRDPAMMLRDTLEAIGFINAGNEIIPDAALTFAKALGSMYGYGLNYAIDQDAPHLLALPAVATPASFQYRYSDGSNGVTGTAFDPTNLDDLAGGLTALSTNNKWSTSRVYVFASNNIKIQRGQSEYDTKENAIQDIGTGAFVTEPSILANGMLIAYIVAQKTCSALNASTAVIIAAGKFGGAGQRGSGGAGVLVQADITDVTSTAAEVNVLDVSTAAPTVGHVLTSTGSGTVPTWQAPLAGNTTLATSATDVTSTAAEVNVLDVSTAAPTVGHVLTSTGSGTVPTWQAPLAGNTTLATSATDVTATAGEVNILDIGTKTVGHVLTIAAGGTTAAWAVATGGAVYHSHFGGDAGTSTAKNYFTNGGGSALSTNTSGTANTGWYWTAPITGTIKKLCWASQNANTNKRCTIENVTAATSTSFVFGATSRGLETTSFAVTAGDAIGLYADAGTVAWGESGFDLYLS